MLLGGLVLGGFDSLPTPPGDKGDGDQDSLREGWAFLTKGKGGHFKCSGMLVADHETLPYTGISENAHQQGLSRQ